MRIVISDPLLSPVDTAVQFRLHLVDSCNKPFRCSTELLAHLDLDGILAEQTMMLAAGESYALQPVESGKLPCAVLVGEDRLPIAMIGRTHAFPAHAHYRVAPILELRGLNSTEECEMAFEALRSFSPSQEETCETSTQTKDAIQHILQFDYN